MRRVARIALKPATARALERASKKLVDALAQGEDPEIGSSYKTEGIKKALRDEMFEGCCAFCEVHTEPSGYGEVEHYKPKALPAFKPLAYTWTNLLWSCKRCNVPKSSHWNAAAPLLDPTVDEPTVHLEWHGPKVVGRTSRGEYTVTLLDLNGDTNLQRYESRKDVLTAVALAWKTLQSAADRAPREMAREVLVRFLGPGSEYRGMLTANGFTSDTIPQL